jgi:carboxyl-terminal processing protease
VGEKTYGKGSVQKLYDLDNGGAVKLTAELWLTSKGNSIQDIGIEADYEVKLDDNYYETRDDADDNQLQKALEILNK